MKTLRYEFACIRFLACNTLEITKITFPTIPNPHIYESVCLTPHYEENRIEFWTLTGINYEAEIAYLLSLEKRREIANKLGVINVKVLKEYRSFLGKNKFLVIDELGYYFTGKK